MLLRLDFDSWTWHKLKNGPVPLAGASMIYFNNTIIVMGGISIESKLNSQTLIYDISSEQWSSNESEGWIARSKFGLALLNESIYAMFGWNDKLDVEEPSILIFDAIHSKFSNFECEFSPNIIVENYGFASDGSSLYIYGGFSQRGVTNALLKFSPESNSLTVLTKKFSSPKNLMNASLVRITTFLYLFGGMYEDTRYNELWKFDVEAISWSKSKSYGDIPSPRSHHSAAADGDIMVIFGGKDAIQYFNDAFQLNSITLTWSLLQYKGLNPSSRFSACLVLKFPIIYIYGGETLSGFSSSLYKYNISDITYEIISESKGFTLGNGQLCYLNKAGDELRILYGTSDGDEPLGYVQSYNLTSNSWKTIYKPSVNDFNRARPIIAQVNSNYYITGGSTWATSPKKEIIKLDTTSSNSSVIDYLDKVAYQAPSVRYKSKVYIYGGGSSYKDLIRYDIATREFFSFDLFDLCDDDCKYVCSEGTYYNETTKACEICPPGTYSPYAGSDQCFECYAGTYNDKYGASNKRQCYPCNQGQFSPANGSTFCFDCQVGYYCPIGSALPLIKYSESTVSYVQPKPYQRKTSEAMLLARNIQIIILAVGFSLFLFVLSFSKARKYIPILEGKFYAYK